jgi:hypothetical protein
MEAARREGGKVAAARREGVKAATASGGGGSHAGIGRRWAACRDDEVSEERSRDDEERGVCREYLKGFFPKCPPHHLIPDGGSSF